MKRNATARLILWVIGIAAVIGAVVWVGLLFNIIPTPTYTGQHFGIERLCSESDFNGNGMDDYTDLLLGARMDAENHPKYDGSYFDGGYPPDSIGVCTDVVWRAFKQAGYSLREMVDRDIAADPDSYPAAQSRDKNIDFRRVRNLRVFFNKYATALTLDTNDIDQWQPGDIVIFGADKHIGIVSDKRNSSGQVYIIHNGGQPVREEDYLKRGEVTGHYRFDATIIPEEALVAWGADEGYKNQ